MLRPKEWVLKGDQRHFLEMREGSIAWGNRVLIGLFMWTVKSPGMVAGIGVERNTWNQVPKYICVVEGVLPATLPTKA